ncbi:hypothetical protein BDW02DRAFT_652169 [Decorospora gaudefroyi]|uniref:Uncharacterized protein n=1 Tax=Decorospora gaudefroyi TaxID=184978 RepID=A0A6A5K4A5_9PLEO|nr:hypothetical protein BDW02DRAFT_652169 [Decorospora gaudefroyi]
MLSMKGLFSLLLPVLVTAQTADKSLILNTLGSTGAIPPSSTGLATMPLVTTVISDGQLIVQTTGYTTIYPRFGNTSTSTGDRIDSTSLSTSLGSQTLTAITSSTLSTALSSSNTASSDSSRTLLSTGTDGFPVSSSSSIGTNSPISSSSTATGGSSSTVGSLISTSSVYSSDSSMSASSSLSPGEASSGSSSVSLSVSASNSDTVQTDSSATTTSSGSPNTTPPPVTTTSSYSNEEIESYLSMTSWDITGVSSTITEDASISASSTSNSEWKKNFWLHTTVDGRPTDLPVVHCGCVCKDNCDDDDDDDDWPALWIIYFNVPKLPNVQVSLPKLPDFHLPGCIKIKVPIINIEIPLGKCPPVSDNGQHGHSDPDDPDNKNKEPDPNDPKDPNDPDDPDDTEPSNTPSSGQESSTSASSSSSSCSGAVVTDYLTHISCPTIGASATECATEIETGTRSGCSLTGTASVTVSASEIAAACNRQVWPNTFGPGVAYTEPGVSYGTYAPPDISQGLTASFGSMTRSDSSSMSGSSIGASNTASFSSMTISDSSGMIGPSTGASGTSSFFSMTVSKSSGMTGTSVASSRSSAVSGSASDSRIPSGTPTSTSSPSSTSADPSSPTEHLDCESNTNPYWVNSDSMQKGISDFCEEASQATDWDDGEGRRMDINGKYHKMIERKYNEDTDDQVVLFISSTNDDLDNAFEKIDKDDCNSKMTKIYDECPPGTDDLGVDRRHGGDLVDGNGLSWTIVTDNFKYG